MRTPSVPTPPDAQTLSLALGAGRCVLAASALAAPVTTARLLGLDTATAARVAWLTRMMAIRDATIGAGVFDATRGSGPAAPWLLAGAASDAVDAVVVAGAIRQGRLRGLVPSGLVVGAAAFAAAGVLAARGVRR